MLGCRQESTIIIAHTLLSSDNVHQVFPNCKLWDEYQTIHKNLDCNFLDQFKTAQKIKNVLPWNCLYAKWLCEDTQAQSEDFNTAWEFHTIL